jgi:hypothetical protein
MEESAQLLSMTVEKQDTGSKRGRGKLNVL